MNSRKNEVFKMKKFFNSIRNKITGTACAIQSTIANKKAEGYVDSGVIS